MIYFLRPLIYLTFIYIAFFGYAKLSHAAWYYVPDSFTTNFNAKIVYYDLAGTRLVARLKPYTPQGGFVIDVLNPTVPQPLNQVGLILPPLAPSMLVAAQTQPPAQPSNFLDFVSITQLSFFIGEMLILFFTSYGIGATLRMMRDG